MKKLHKHWRKKPALANLKRIADLDLAWLAGLLEGEGYFCVLHNNHSDTLNIGCGMTDRDVIKHLLDVVGAGKVSSEKGQGKGYKRVYRWTLTNSNAFALMELLSRLPVYRIRSIYTGIVETPYVLRTWCKERGISRDVLDATMRGRRGRKQREHVNGYVREQ